MARRLAAILAADVVGYSALMNEDEAGMLEALRAHRKELFNPETAKRHGRAAAVLSSKKYVLTLYRFSGCMGTCTRALDGMEE